MKILLDTSVVVAALVRAHPQHARSLPWLAKSHSGEIELVLAAHSLAETYAALTSLPVKPRISPSTARTLIRDNRLPPDPDGIAEVLALSAEEVFAVIDRASELSLAGGIVYDALIAKVAEVARVDHLVTMNPKHFRRAWPEGAERIREP